ncbi:MAG: M48 family metalloprotease, partial [Planctomycetes bacterium]|nr:M48 family metalloprotease [Planctomycetota bacterium]
QPEIFHKGTQEVYITEGLVKQCQTDGQLAAVLCHELGKMVSEREALAGPKVLHPDRPPPIEVPIGNDNIGGTPDLTGLAERAKFSPHPPPASPVGVSLPPDPNVLARGYLAKAQFSEAELDNVQALLAAAAQNCSLERQLVGVATPPS